jgi:predicted Zn-ribbon and HTH transcriptional regulator
MPIENRNLSVGTILIGKYHKQGYSVEVIQGENGKLLYRLQDGREFKNPSGAGMAVTGHSCDGWKFWSVETTLVSKAQPAETQEVVTGVATTAESPTSPKKRNIFRAPNQKGIPAGQTRWYCKDCGESFLADMGTIPGTCPKGHANS